ncbi:hypothetical protein Csa_023651, partial [Cucumis sativus]
GRGRPWIPLRINKLESSSSFFCLSKSCLSALPNPLIGCSISKLSYRSDNHEDELPSSKMYTQYQHLKYMYKYQDNTDLDRFNARSHLSPSRSKFYLPPETDFSESQITTIS